MKDEIWVPVIGYEGKYEVSDIGKVRSLDRWVFKEIVGKEVLRRGVVLSQTKNKENYALVTIYGGEKWKAVFSVHILEYYSFNIDEIKDNSHEIDHIDNNPSNNNLSNLQRITCRQNSIKRSLNNTKTSKYTGVSWCKERGKWQSHIRIKDHAGKSRTKYLGRFLNELEASEAYKKALETVEKPAVLVEG